MIIAETLIGALAKSAEFAVLVTIMIALCRP